MMDRRKDLDTIFDEQTRSGDRLQESGRYTFVREEALRELNLNAASLKKAGMRLAAKARVAVPSRGFCVIVPLEYRVAGAPPPTWFIDGLMIHLGHPYYAGLLSAGALYGAAHQQPQDFQVITDRPQRLMRAGGMCLILSANQCT
jgi:hypothetical protein